MTGEDEVRYKTNVEGTKNILEASITAKVKRFVYISTIAVHGRDPGPEVDENSPMLYGKDVYADSKIDAEKLVFRYGGEKGLPIVVLRPTIVYGPRSGSWTLGPIINMKKGKFTLIEGGSGIVNHVYIDDVIQAMLLAATRPEAVGEAFTISYGSVITWKEFFGYYARMLNIDLPNITLKMINHEQRQIDKLHNPINMGLSFVASPHAQSVISEIPWVGAGLKQMINTLPNGWKQTIFNRARIIREIKLNPPSLPSQSQIDFFCARGICKIDKAQRILCYQPQFSLNEGMQLTEAWLRYSKLI